MFLLTLSAWAQEPAMRVHFIDVGQGDATLVEFPCGAMLVDAGGEENDLFDGVDQLDSYLEAFFARRQDLNNTLDLLVFTHPHIDHVRGAEMVLERYTIEHIVDNGHTPESNNIAGPPVQAVRDFVNAHNEVRYRSVSTNDFRSSRSFWSPTLDPFRRCQGANPSVRALWGQVPEDPGWGSHYGKLRFDNQNNHSVVLRVKFGDTTMLLTGDLETHAINSMLAARRALDLDVDLYQVGHHGSYNGTNTPLLEAMTPAWAVMSTGSPERAVPWTAWAYGHPRRDLVESLQQHVTEPRDSVTVQVGDTVRAFSDLLVEQAIYATGWDGTVVLEGDKDGLITVGEADWLPPEPGPVLEDRSWDDLPWETDADNILTVTFIDVDQGDAILIQLGDTDLLVDAGRGWSRLSSGLPAISGALEALFITHPHDDHFGGAAGLLGSQTVDAIITNGERRGPPRDPSPMTRWTQFETAVGTAGLTLAGASVGDTWTFGGLTIEALSSGGQYPDQPSGTHINNDSLVLMLEYAGRKVLLTGDIEEAAGEHLVAEYCPQGPTNCPVLAADVLKVPHHGSAHFAPAFFEAVSAEWSVVSAGYEKTVHHLPRYSTLQALEDLGSTVYSTSDESADPVVLAIGPAGEIGWDVPDDEPFYWHFSGGNWAGEALP
jgi:competence protein ComEC